MFGKKSCRDFTYTSKQIYFSCYHSSMEVGIFMMCTVVQGITLQMLAKKIFQKKSQCIIFYPIFSSKIVNHCCMCICKYFILFYFCFFRFHKFIVQSQYAYYVYILGDPAFAIPCQHLIKRELIRCESIM